MRKSQSAIEAAILIAFMNFSLILVLFASYQKLSEAQAKNDEKALDDLLAVVETELALASSASDGYYREFELPSSVNGRDYRITFVPEEGTGANFTEVEFRLANSTMVQNAITPNDVRGSVCRGRNLLVKTAGIINVTCYECFNYIDDDLDGCMDFPVDTGCTSQVTGSESDGPCMTECWDSIDNDGNGCADFPADTGCTSSLLDNDESAGFCNNPPSISLVSDSPDPAVVGSSVIFSSAASDPDAQEVSLYVCRDSSCSNCGPSALNCWAASPTSPSNPSASYSCTLIQTANFWARACDSFGLCSSVIPGGTFSCTSPPSLSSVSDSPDPQSIGSSISFASTASDPDFRPIKLYVCRDSSCSNCGPSALNCWATSSSSSSSNPTASYPCAGTQTGSYWARVCNDQNLCSSILPGTFSCVPDATGPVGGYVRNNNGYLTTTQMLINVSPGTDPESGMSSNNSNYLLEYSYSPLSNSVCTAFGGHYDAGVSETAAASSYWRSGSGGYCYKFRYTAKNSIGIPTIYYGTDVAKIDTWAPYSSALPYSGYFSSNIPVGVSDSDPWSGLGQCFYSVDDTGRAGIEVNTTRPCSSNITITVHPATGICRTGGSSACRLTVWAADNAGLTGTRNTYYYNIDFTPPVMSDAKPSGMTGNNPVILKVTTSENSVCRYSTTNNFDFSQGTDFRFTGGTSHSHYFYNVPGGSYTYYFKCRDTAGNLAASQLSVTYTASGSYCADGTSEEYLGYGSSGNVFGCYGLLGWKDAGSLCAAGRHRCTVREVANLPKPLNRYWTSSMAVYCWGTSYLCQIATVQSCGYCSGWTYPPHEISVVDYDAGTPYGMSFASASYNNVLVYGTAYCDYKCGTDYYQGYIEIYDKNSWASAACC